MKKVVYIIINSNLFYIGLILIFFLIRIFPGSVGSSHLDAIINECSSGGLASVLVALLIKLKDNSYHYQIKKQISSGLMPDLYRNIYGFIHLPIRTALLYDITIEENHSYKEWCDITNSILNKGKQNGRFIRDYNGALYLIETWFSRYKEKKDWLILEEILTSEEQQFISDIEKVFGFMMAWGTFEDRVEMNTYEEIQKNLIDVLQKYDITKTWCSMDLNQSTMWSFSDYYQP